MHLRRPSIFELTLWVIGGLVLFFILAPIAGMYLSTSFPELKAAVFESEVQKSIGLTIGVSMAGTILFAVLAIPFAYLLARKNIPFKRLITGIIDVPIVIPHSAAGIALLGVLSRDTWLGQLAAKAGISFVGAPLGIMLAMAFVSVPFLIKSARDGFEAVPERLEKAALTLGASPFRVFMTISVPLAWRSILSGMVMMWARGVSEFGAVIVVAYHPMITPVLIFQRFSDYGLKHARPVAAVFILICLVIFVLSSWLSAAPLRRSRR